MKLDLAAMVSPGPAWNALGGVPVRALSSAAPHTTSLRDTCFEVDPAGVLPRAGACDVGSPVTASHAKLSRRPGGLVRGRLAEVEARLCGWFGLRAPTSASGA